ncbi:MAG TPA: mechanosensitive ion channel domain-containing protein [Candidatus Acidoferrum sp.]|nr:mechanosensitive ion channel domain-containing protein [Candidatus Acidoferrum sp.]
MKRYEKATLIVLSVLTLLAIAAVLFTRDWANYRDRFRASQQASQRAATALVDTTALDTAQNLAPLAVTHHEREEAQESLRLGDYSVDLGFSIATQQAEDNPAPMTPEIRSLSDRLKTAQTTEASDQALVSGLNEQLKGASATDTARIQSALAIFQTQLSLDQDDVQDLQQQLIRAGGDKQATIQQLLDQHNASEAHAEKSNNDLAANVSSPESTTAHNVLAESRALISLRSKEKQILQAQQEAEERGASLQQSHEAMQKEMEEARTNSSSASADGMSMLQRMSGDQKEAAAIAKRMETEEQLASVYMNWAAFVGMREKAFIHEILVAFLWIMIIAMAAWAANLAIQRAFARVAFERRQMHTFRVMTIFVVEAAAFVAILLVVFGVPTNLTTFLALTTAGFTVAMQDFILGFFGWFILMGRNGIRPGDWVEINGVSGEVVDVSVFHTVLLETGSGADAGHPTGRRVSFMNNYAIQGHFFNFSTTGQWMWDEIEVQITDEEPYARAEAVQKIVADLTTENVRLAEGEWDRVAPFYVKKTFSAVPAMSIRPAGAGVTVSVRYITRANERYDLRAKIYRAIVELLHNKPEPEPASSAPHPSSGKS